MERDNHTFLWIMVCQAMMRGVVAATQDDEEGASRDEARREMLLMAAAVWAAHWCERWVNLKVVNVRRP